MFGLCLYQTYYAYKKHVVCHKNVCDSVTTVCSIQKHSNSFEQWDQVKCDWSRTKKQQIKDQNCECFGTKKDVQNLYYL